MAHDYEVVFSIFISQTSRHSGGKKKDLDIFRFRISIMGLRDSIRGHEGTAGDTDDSRAGSVSVC